MSDLSITAANVVPAANAILIDGIAGATIAAGQLCYKDSTNQYQLSDANGAAALRTVDGIAVNSASSGQPIKLQTGGDLNPGATVVVGKPYVLSATAGGIAPVTDLATGHYVSTIGIGTTASNISVKIHNSGVAVP